MSEVGVSTEKKSNLLKNENVIKLVMTIVREYNIKGLYFDEVETV